MTNAASTNQGSEKSRIESLILEACEDATGKELLRTVGTLCKTVRRDYQEILWFVMGLHSPHATKDGQFSHLLLAQELYRDAEIAEPIDSALRCLEDALSYYNRPQTQADESFTSAEVGTFLPGQALQVLCQAGLAHRMISHGASSVVSSHVQTYHSDPRIGGSQQLGVYSSLLSEGTSHPEFQTLLESARIACNQLCSLSDEDFFVFAVPKEGDRKKIEKEIAEIVFVRRYRNDVLSAVKDRALTKQHSDIAQQFHRLISTLPNTFERVLDSSGSSFKSILRSRLQAIIVRKILSAEEANV